jgi:hypothetical protein
MNAARRKALDTLLASFEGLKSELETLRDEEQDYYDNMPESFQSGDKGQAAETAVSALDDAINSADEVVGYIETAKE